MKQGFFSRLADAMESKHIQRGITILIIINAVILGLETSDTVMAKFGSLLEGIDHAILAVFVIELSIKMIGRRLAFFRSGWNIFDLVVVGIAIVPAAETLSVLRHRRSAGGASAR